MTIVALVPAAAAAGCNALSSVLQRKANLAEVQDHTSGPMAFVHLLRRPAWLLGVLSMLASFVLQALALSIGTLSAVEPVLVLELPSALILGSWMLGRPLCARDRWSAVVMALGLAAFIAVLSPAGGSAGSIPTAQAVVAAGITAAAIIGIALVAQLGPARWRAALFGIAAGSGFGLTAAMIKVAVTRLSDSGVGALLTTWETYGLAGFGLGSVVLVQCALHAGTLVAAQPGITLLDPLVSLLWGTVVFGETTRTGPLLIVAGAGAAAVVTAAVSMVRSPASSS